MNQQKARQREFKYLRYTLDYKLHYIGYLAVLEGYNDVNWILNTKNLKSISKYIFTLGEAIVSQKSFKQIFIVRYTIESELITFNKVREEVK